MIELNSMFRTADHQEIFRVTNVNGVEIEFEDEQHGMKMRASIVNNWINAPIPSIEVVWVGSGVRARSLLLLDKARVWNPPVSRFDRDFEIEDP